MVQQLLIIGHTFPEPTTTAAGNRMMQLIEVFQEANFSITFASTAKKTEASAALKDKNIEEISIQVNDDSFDAMVTKLQPTVVLFDRYITEEQFGWRIAEQCPNTLRILDTEDLHFLRKAREEAFKKSQPLDLYSNTAKREIASILRSDMSLIISEFEMKLLLETFNISSTILYYLPFLLHPFSEEHLERLTPYKHRNGFVTIGNLHHAPNIDAVLYLKKDIWPKIKQHLPEATLSIYGKYAPQHIVELHHPKEGFLVKGWAPSVAEIMQQARICIAPLRFGAGLKGKLIDAMYYGTPSVTTSIGAEGMTGTLPFSGGIADDIEIMVNKAVRLYTELEHWKLQQLHGFNILLNRFQKETFQQPFIDKVLILQGQLDAHRTKNFMGQLLQQQTTQASKYLSKWIAEKNKK